MTFWIDIEDRAGVKYGDGPITSAVSWNYAPRLSQSGTFSFTMPASDARAALCKPRRVARCYQVLNDVITEVGAGVIDNIEVSTGNGPTMLTVSGNDLLRELTWASTVDLALMEREPETPYLRTVTYSGGSTWTGFPTSIRLTSGQFLYVGSYEEFTTLELTLSAVNSVDKKLEIQFYDERLGGWAAVDYEDGTDVGGVPLAQSGTITMQKLDGWGKFDGRYIVRLWSPEGDMDSITVTDAEITRWVETDTALASIMAFAPAGWALAGSPYYATTAAGVYLPSAGRNVLECLTAVSRVTGEQFRLGTGRSIEWLRSDTPDSGLVAVGPVTPQNMETTDTRALLRGLRRSQDTFDLGSRVLPRGGGDEERVTLALTSRTAPAGYVLNTTANYIERTAAETYLNAVVEMPIEDLRIKATDTSSVQGENAANALYDWALEFLQTHSATADADVPAAYDADVLRLISVTKPGDKMRVRYTEYRDGYEVMNVNALLVMLAPTIRIDQSGAYTTAITFATQARWPKGDQDVTVDLINQALSARGGGAGGGTSMMVTHDIIGGFHFVDGTAGDLVGVNPDDTLTLLSVADLIDIVGGLFVGRQWGAHVGAMKYLSPDGWAIELQVTDSAGTPLFSAGSILDVENSFWIKLGKAGSSQITYTNDGTTGLEQFGVWSIPHTILGNPSVRTVTDTTTELTTDDVIVCNKGTAMTVNLLAATGSGRQLTVKSIGAGAVTVDANASETIDGETTQVLEQWDALKIVDYASGAWGII